MPDLVTRDAVKTPLSVKSLLKKPIFTSAFFIPKFQNLLNDSKRLILQAIKSIKTFSVPSIFPKISRYFSSLVKFGYIFGYKNYSPDEVVRAFRFDNKLSTTSNSDMFQIFDKGRCVIDTSQG